MVQSKQSNILHERDRSRITVLHQLNEQQFVFYPQDVASKLNYLIAHLFINLAKYINNLFANDTTLQSFHKENITPNALHSF